jgi:hypothetical protein
VDAAALLSIAPKEFSLPPAPTRDQRHHDYLPQYRREARHSPLFPTGRERMKSKPPG